MSIRLSRKRLLPIVYLFVLAFLASPIRPYAAAIPLEPPADAVAAEEAGHWDEAIALYQKALAADPTRFDLWDRMADIESQNDHPAKAAEYESKAIALRPNDIALVRKHAELASWAGDNKGAEQSYRKLVALDPRDDESLYTLGNVISWQGRNADAIAVIETYLTHRPNDAKAIFFISQLYTWNGDSEKAVAALQRYKQLAGADNQYNQAIARFLAESNQNQAAVAAADAVLKNDPENCDANTSRAIALSHTHQTAQLSDSLAQMSEHCSDADSREQLRQLGTPLRSQVHGGFAYSTDSDSIDIGQFTLDARYRLDPARYLLIGTETGWLSANIGSGLETATGRSRVNLSGGWVGIEQAINAQLLVSGQAGYRATTAATHTPLAHGSADYQLNDDLTLHYDLDRDFYAVSPLALSRGITLTDNHLSGTWLVGGGVTLGLEGHYGFLSDSNQYRSIIASARHGIVSGEKLTIEAGISSQFTNFTQTPSNGYYDPTAYRQFLFNIDGSYAFNSDTVVRATVSPGIVKDGKAGGYQPSGSYAVEGDFGLYADVMLVVRASLTQSLGIGNRAYSAQSYTVDLTRRF